MRCSGECKLLKYRNRKGTVVKLMPSRKVRVMMATGPATNSDHEFLPHLLTLEKEAGSAPLALAAGVQQKRDGDASLGASETPSKKARDGAQEAVAKAATEEVERKSAEKVYGDLDSVVD